MNTERRTGVVLSYIQVILNVLVNIIYVPVLLHYLGQSEYGLYQIVGSFFSYVTVFESCMSAGVLRNYCNALGKQDEQLAREILSTARSIYRLMAAGMTGLGVVVILGFRAFYASSFTGAELQESTIILGMLFCNMVATLLERILAFMGAAEASARMNAQKAVKQLRNQINRQTNCDTANLGKTARANAQTTRAIRFLQEQGALETLPEVLQQAAAIRMENPDLSLTALCACFDPPVSKSGLSHRMKKLEALAEDLRRRLEENVEKEETK